LVLPRWGRFQNLMQNIDGRNTGRRSAVGYDGELAQGRLGSEWLPVRTPPRAVSPARSRRPCGAAIASGHSKGQLGGPQSSPRCAAAPNTGAAAITTTVHVAPLWCGHTVWSLKRTAGRSPLQSTLRCCPQRCTAGRSDVQPHAQLGDPQYSPRSPKHQGRFWVTLPAAADSGASAETSHSRLGRHPRRRGQPWPMLERQRSRRRCTCRPCGVAIPSGHLMYSWAIPEASRPS
jgi:hypothetical protein